MNWMLDDAGYKEAELKLGLMLRRAFEEARNRKTVSLWDRNLVHHRSGRYLLACNSHGRLLWAEAYCAVLSKFFDLDEEDKWLDEPVYLLTIVDLACCTTDEPQEIPIKRFRSKLRPQGQGLNYVGMIEPAYYTNLCQGAWYKGKRAVSWHAHYIVWGISGSELKGLVAEWNKAGVYRSIAEGIPAAHCKEIDRNTLANTVCYTLKSPANGYRLYKREVIKKDGEIVLKFAQRKQELRKGERVRLFRLSKHLYLDQMALAGGRGVGLLLQIKRTALAPYNRIEANRLRRRARQGPSMFRKRARTRN